MSDKSEFLVVFEILYMKVADSVSLSSENKVIFIKLCELYGHQIDNLPFLGTQGKIAVLVISFAALYHSALIALVGTAGLAYIGVAAIPAGVWPAIHALTASLSVARNVRALLKE